MTDDRRPIRALDTKYRGFAFRSRLEARWAVFFDGLGLGFRYEPEGFDLREAEYYLPDFYLPRLRLWVEVKPKPPTAGERWRCRRLAELQGERVACVVGPPDLPGHHGEAMEFLSAYMWLPQPLDGDELIHATEDELYWWCECPFCGAIDLQFNGRAARIRCCEQNAARRDGGDDKGYAWATERLRNAVEMSRGVRFDQGDPWSTRIEP